MSMVWFIFLGVVLYIVAQYHWSRRHLYIAAMNLNGPPSLPIFGSSLLFVFYKTENYMHKLYEIVEKYDNPFRFWLGPHLLICFKEPQHLDKILSSSKFSHKHDIYNLLKEFLGEGLISASGPNYKNDKKILQPLFGLGYATECATIFEKHIKVCIQNLESYVDQDYFDIGHAIHLCTTDIMGEIILGYDFSSQNGSNMKYVQALTDIYKLAFERIIKPWLHFNLFFNSSSIGKKYKMICHMTNALMEKVIEKSSQRSKDNENSSSITPIVDKINEYKKLHPDSIPDNEFGAHLITLYMASQDTIALIASAACLCFGLYPAYQRKAVEEIHEVFGKNTENINVENIKKLSYLDMCVKDLFRLFPIAPYLLRKNLEEQRIDEWLLPQNCGILIPIYNLHKNPQYWENPDHFHPDHFLPQQKRPTYSYIPFSAGPRSCIGKIFGNIGVKIILIKLLQNFEFEASGKLPDVQLTMDISLRSLNGYKVKIKRRSD